MFWYFVGSILNFSIAHSNLSLCDDVLVFLIFCVSTFVHNTTDMANIWFETSVLPVLDLSWEMN